MAYQARKSANNLRRLITLASLLMNMFCWVQISSQISDGLPNRLNAEDNPDEKYAQIKPNPKKLYEELERSAFPIFKESKTAVRTRGLSKGEFPGFGNFLLGVITDMQVAFATKSAALLDHALVVAMFDHPDPRINHFMKYDIIDGAVVNMRKQDVANHVYKFPDGSLKSGKDWASFQGTNRYNNHRDAMKMSRDYYASVLGMDPRDPRLYDVASSTVTQWMMSRPTQIFQRYYDEFRGIVLKRCGGATANIDFAVQFRTWKDHRYSQVLYQKHDKCTFSCVHEKVLAAVRRKEQELQQQAQFKAVSTGRSTDKAAGGDKANTMCIFVTTDDHEYLTPRINALRQNMSTLTNIDIIFVNSNGYNRAPEEWHTKSLVRQAIQSFNTTLFPRYKMLFDWMLLGDAASAILTYGSTYSRTARMRGGYERQRWDSLVGTPDGQRHRGNKLRPLKKRGTGECECKDAQPADLRDLFFSGLGVMKK